MRHIALLLFALLFCTPVFAKDSASASQRKLKGFLDNLTSWESTAKGVEPLLGGQPKEIERRHDVLFQMMEKNVKPLSKEVSRYRGEVDQTYALPAQSVEDAITAFSGWLDAKMTLLNAGAKNPGLEAIRSNEKTAFAEYQTKLKAARDALK